MFELCQEKDKLTSFAEDVGIPLHIYAVELEEELTQVREDRIYTIRRQLAEGTYSIDERLNAVLDRLHEDLAA
jgi:anti-sigma28 factor (negative regulator of flagellin synthesis)